MTKRLEPPNDSKHQNGDYSAATCHNHFFLRVIGRTLRLFGWGLLGGKVENQIFRNGTIVTDLNSLIIFAEVADANSFSEAARRLKMPTSTVSRRVADL